MKKSPSYIHFRSKWQILGPDLPGQGSDRKRFYDLMNKLNEPPISADFDDFSYRSDRCEMGKLRGNHPEGGLVFSKLVFSGNELTLVEEWSDISADEFKDKFVNVLTSWFVLFPKTAVISQNCCLRALVQPLQYNDSRQFLGDRVLQIGKYMHETFQDMPFRVGFTVGCVRHIQDYTLFIDTTVNSWRDNRTVWVEVNGTSPMAKPINATNPQTAKQPFEVCKSFLENEVINFLEKFDVVEGDNFKGANTK